MDSREWERERERERERVCVSLCKRQRERVCLCVCEREKEREVHFNLSTVLPFVVTPPFKSAAKKSRILSSLFNDWISGMLKILSGPESPVLTSPRGPCYKLDFYLYYFASKSILTFSQSSVTFLQQIIYCHKLGKWSIYLKPHPKLWVSWFSGPLLDMAVR